MAAESRTGGRRMDLGPSHSLYLHVESMHRYRHHHGAAGKRMMIEAAGLGPHSVDWMLREVWMNHRRIWSSARREDRRHLR